eukprot:TRINITY_DN6371_c0_g2_i1.p2 TRINITY_DN6371_c0_g2~~TRINITY_DN6371_c0_g2_i1.p2  ORF type:complete len:256 (-),score=33.60 TRINITY_DN6371_c0_g2_i1:44-811(-)
MAIRATLNMSTEMGTGEYLGPLYLRLAWHASGTYSAVDHTGGSCTGATMRFAPESTQGANNGLAVARDALATVRAAFPGISYADLWQLAAVVAVADMGGPEIAFVPGRKDASNCARCAAWLGRLPDGNRTADHVRAVFGRMGLTDRETVALVGAHTVGRTHQANSGWSGPWTWNPTVFDNSFFQLLRGQQWAAVRQSNDQIAFHDPTGQLLMLPTDMALLTDPQFAMFVLEFANDQAAFFAAFSSAFAKLVTGGC